MGKVIILTSLVWNKAKGQSILSNIRIVTDRATLFTHANIVKQYPITVLPAYIKFGETVYEMGREIDNEQIIHLLQTADEPPSLVAPTAEEFFETYERLSRQGITQILSIHTAASLYPAWHNARSAHQMILGRCEIVPLDAKTVSVGVGILVEMAAKLAMDGVHFEQIVREVRLATERIYTLFFVESLETLQQRGLMDKAQTILGSMLGIKTFLGMEDGRMAVVEKTQTMSQAIDRLAEFGSEFEEVEQVVILSYTPELLKPIRQLQDKLALGLSTVDIPIIQYGGFLATTLGPDAIGVLVLENPLEFD